MTTLTFVSLESTDPAAAAAFYRSTFDLQDCVRVHPVPAATTGFRGFTLSLVVPGPGTVDALLDAAVAAGAAVLKPTAKNLWGYGASVKAPDGAIWKIATSAKKDPGPVTRRVDDVVLLLGVEDVAAGKHFYVEHGLTVSRSFGRMYAEFAAPPAGIKLALYRRRALAKDAGVPDEAAAGHGIVIGGDAGAFTDPDGFRWQAASSPAVVEAAQ